MGVQCLPRPTGDAPLWDCWTTWKPNWNTKSPPNYRPPGNKPWTTANPFATIAAWLFTDTIATPAPLPPATAKSAGRSLCSVAGNAAVWLVV